MGVGVAFVGEGVGVALPVSAANAGRNVRPKNVPTIKVKAKKNFGTFISIPEHYGTRP